MTEQPDSGADVRRFDGLRFQGELPMAGTVVAWYAIDRADWQDASRQHRAAPAG